MAETFPDQVMPEAGHAAHVCDPLHRDFLLVARETLERRIAKLVKKSLSKRVESEELLEQAKSPSGTTHRGGGAVMNKKNSVTGNDTLPVRSEFLLYQSEDGQTRIEVRLEKETVWLNQLTMAELFQTSKQNISLHLRNIFSEAELVESQVVKEYLTTAADGKGYRTKFYNLEAIIAVGYRVKSHRGTQFRRWATERLNEYLVRASPWMMNA